jgi:exonuclease VII large subunit
MTSTADMSTPVTRGELIEELAKSDLRLDDKFANFESRVDDKLAKLESRLDDKLAKLESRLDDKLVNLESRIEQKFDHKLDLWGGALLARIAVSENRLSDLALHVVASEQRLSADLARHIGALQESISLQLSAFEDKYCDLPARVRRLEDRRGS